MSEVKKVVILLAGLGTRFLPLSKIVPKEFWPLVDKPIIQYIVEEAVNSGIKEIIFVVRPDNKLILKYLDHKGTFSETKKLLTERKEEKILEEVKNFEKILGGINFSYVYQDKPMGDGQAILEAKKKIKDEPFGVLFSDDVVYSKTPVLSQLISLFNNSKKPVLSLYNLKKEKLSSYGVAKVEKIANRHYKVLGVVEKPSIEKIPSNFAIVGKYLLTPEIFEELKNSKSNKKGEIILAEAISSYINSGKTIYGKEIEGEWLECGNKLAWIKSNIRLSLKNPKYTEEIKKIINELK